MANGVCEVKKPYKEISFTVPWGVIAAKAWGPDDGKPFIGLHGWLDNANSFDRLAPLLPTDIRFIAIDFPGHGRSSHRSPGMPCIYYFEFVADVKKVVSQLGWERFSIISHSMGCVIGTLYAGTFPNEVDILTCLDMGRTMVHVEDEVAGVLARYATKMSNLKKPTPRVYHSLESAAARWQESLIGVTLRKEDAMLLTERGTRTTEAGLIFSHDPILKGLFRPFTEPQSFMISVLSNTQCDVLVLESTEYVQYTINAEDRECQLEKIRMICQNAKCKVWKEIQGGHHFHMEMPKQVAQEIKDFLNLFRSRDQPLPSKL